jgi:hypothetical protein
MASECARADVAERRRVWVNHRQPHMRRHPGRLVFIDETSVNTKMTRLRGRAKRGKRLKASAPFGRWGTQTFIAGLRHDGLTPFTKAPRLRLPSGLAAHGCSSCPNTRPI